MEGLLLWVLDQARGLLQRRRRIRVGVHQAYFRPASVPHYFIKVTNLSPARDIEITHVWVEGHPGVHVLLPERPLPKRLRPDQQTEFWVSVAAVSHIKNPERAIRVRLTDARVIRSQIDKGLPEEGYVAGWTS